jgi:hypothetical protein
MSLATNAGMSPVLNGQMPCEGPKALSFNLDFTAATEYDFDLTPYQQQGQFTTVQTAYVDNSANPSTLTINVHGTMHNIVIGPNEAGYVAIIAPTPTKFSVVTAGLINPINLVLLNFYVPPAIWKCV